MIILKKIIPVAIASLLSISAIAQKELKRPNIIWLMAEDMSLDLECYGMEAVKTPNLNKMAAEGVRYDNCFVTNPICSPSRSAMMVGTHQLKINAQNHRSNRDVPLDSRFKPFTALLREAGYTTVLGNHAVMGLGRKTDMNFKSTAIGPWDGKTQFGLFDKYDTFENDGKPFFAQIQLVASHRGDWWNEVREKSAHPVDPNKVKLPSYLADDPAIRLDWAKYLDQIEFLDNEVGMIFKELEDKGLADNTIVVFIGDNGRCNLRGKGYLADSGLRIPFIVHYPQNYKGAHVSKEIVSAVDITATILDWAGVKVPSYITGKSIAQKGFKNDYVYAARDLWDEIEEKSRAVTSDKWKYIRNDKPEVPYDAHQAYLEFYRPAVHIMRKLNEEGKLNEAQKPFFAKTKPVEELYDLEKDPEELHNLAFDKKYSKTLAELRKKTLWYDKEMTPVSDVYIPEEADAVKIFEWVKKEKPELYQQMLSGVEIGFKKMGNQYKAANKTKNNTKQTKNNDE
ncbi:sulfatase family protein [Flavobacterium algicola]|uniref:sulfatase family protein n=1 Tax=Flavobacterium algicola TaxID=556529 RepID=UPI001EFCA573|nr:sulfatase [Flavobacterium algicola]MCG9793711.1 sulfatase [Flavobacterium algicola]